MVKDISIVQYRKLKNINIHFHEGVNIISGSNGTCKTSLLHIISNSYQSVTKSNSSLKNKDCMKIINGINGTLNPKIESLTRGDKEYNDPGNGRKGTLLAVNYYDSEPLEFRRHVSKTLKNSSDGSNDLKIHTSSDLNISNRYAIKPQYKKGTKDSLPSKPVIYLGITRLYPFGEFYNDESLKKVRQSLPVEYRKDLANLYFRYTGIHIDPSSPYTQKMGDIKTRFDFKSKEMGVDSNTISAGEDNLYIILTSLISLRYYFNSIDSKNKVESILLIDEIDSTLHPSLQFLLLDLFYEYSQKYKIQIVFTTHSISLLEYALNAKHNVIYLIDERDHVSIMPSPDIYKIKMYLQDLTRDEIYINRVIPIFTEDDEARNFLSTILEYFESVKSEFKEVKRFFHFVDVNMGSDNLINLFSDKYMNRSTMQAICILDGDQYSKRSLDKCILALPGKTSPEKLVMSYSEQLYDSSTSEFWDDITIKSSGYTHSMYRSKIQSDIKEVESKVEEAIANKKSSGLERNLCKEFFSKHQRFCEFVLTYWVRDPKNKDELDAFYIDIYKMFKKVADFNGISPRIWEIDLEKYGK